MKRLLNTLFRRGWGGRGPFLFFRFRVRRTDIGLSDRIVSHAESALTVGSDTEYTTRFWGGSSQVEIGHEASVQILCLDLERIPVAIPLATE